VYFSYPWLTGPPGSSFPHKEISPLLGLLSFSSSQSFLRPPQPPASSVLFGSMPWLTLPAPTEDAIPPLHFFFFFCFVKLRFLRLTSRWLFSNAFSYNFRPEPLNRGFLVFSPHRNLSSAPVSCYSPDFDEFLLFEPHLVFDSFPSSIRARLGFLPFCGLGIDVRPPPTDTPLFFSSFEKFSPLVFLLMRFPPPPPPPLRVPFPFRASVRPPLFSCCG